MNVAMGFLAEPKLPVVATPSKEGQPISSEKLAYHT